MSPFKSRADLQRSDGENRSESPVVRVQGATLRDIANKNQIVSHTYQNEFSVYFCL